MTEREEFFKHMIDDYLFLDGVDEDGWRWYGARKYKQFGSSGDTTTTYRMQTGFCSHVNIEQKEYVIVETGEDPVANCKERAYAYHSYEEMFDAWTDNYKEMFAGLFEDFEILNEYDKNIKED